MSLTEPPSTPTHRQRERADARIQTAEEREQANAVSVPWAVASLVCDWPARLGPTVVRGAVAAAIDRLCGGTGARDDEGSAWAAHIDWHGHLATTETRDGLPPICYRVRDGIPTVHLVGPRVRERLAELAGVRALQLPGGDVIDVGGVEVKSAIAEVVVSRSRWWRYETASPIFPSRVARRRKPGGEWSRENTPEIRAWAGGVVAASIAGRLAEWGWSCPEDPIAVQIEGYRPERCEWEKRSARPDVGPKRDVAVGFHVAFVSNVRLPPGIALGSRASVGWGEIATVTP